MNPVPVRTFLALLSIPLFALAAAAESPRVRASFDAGWSFAKGDPEGAEQTGFDHADWRELDLPHDWSVEGPFDADHPAQAPGGYLPAGIGWYRKSFELPPGSDGKRVAIEFDGVYMNAEVWINGHRLGKRPYGYIGFQYDLTPHLDFSGENVLAVRVDDSRQPSARWYGGAGIYRHVWLTVTDPLRVAHWGTYVTTPEITDETAAVAIETEIRNDFDETKSVTVKQTIFAADDTLVAEVENDFEADPAATGKLRQHLEIADPARWSPETPHLYTVRTELRDGDRLADRYETPLGVREFRFDADEGFFLNGESVILRGMCNHQDLGPLGTALWDQALERRMRMLKDMGCNAIRTAHYPHSPELMALCDRMGFLVVNETFDEWRRGWAFEDGQLVSSAEPRGKAKFGYNRYFDDWAETDLTDHLRRDRNHPSVILWSIGNEVPEAQKHGEIETVRILRDLCREIDPTRPVTAGINLIGGANETGFLDLLDVVGYNGGGDSVFLYEEDHARFPDRKIYASEVPHSLQTRGEYRTHTKFRLKQHEIPDLTTEEVFPETDGWYESSYDNAAVRITSRDSWELTSTLPFIAGEFRWTGFDYIGESGGWPRVLGNFGIIDLCHFPKDTYYFYQSQWTDEPMVHLLPHWTWPGKEGTPIPVHCYTTGDEAELFLNGESLGTRTFGAENPYLLEWMVPYVPGELRVVARKDGEEIATRTLRTAGAPARIAVDADQTTLDPASRDLSYITVRVEDEDGNFAPKAARWISVRLDGPARVIGIGNGDPLSHHDFQGRTVRTFNGLARVIVAATSEEDQVRPNDKRERNEILVRIGSNGLAGDEVRLKRAAE